MFASARQNIDIDKNKMKYLKFIAHEKLITNDRIIIDIGKAIEIAYSMDLIKSINSIF